MQLTIVEESSGRSIYADLSDSILLLDLQVFIEAELAITPELQVLLLDGNPLENTRATLAELHLKDGDLIALRMKNTQREVIEVSERAEELRQNVTRDIDQPVHLRETDTRWNADIEDRNSFAAEDRRQTEIDRGLKLTRVGQSLRNLTEQAQSLDLIHLRRIDENLQLAYDISPEDFVPVTFLYIKLKINGFATYALVDSGAQKTILHSKLAKQFGILSLIDKRFASMSIGVGSQRSEGIVHSVPVSLGDSPVQLPCSFLILDIHVGILFGLDMLRRHKCCIDLIKDALIVGGQEIKFLSEYQIERLVLPFQATFGADRKFGNVPDEVVKPTEHNRDGVRTAIETSVSQLMLLGFSKDEATRALEQVNGDVELAAALLF